MCDRVDWQGREKAVYAAANKEDVPRTRFITHLLLDVGVSG